MRRMLIVLAGYAVSSAAAMVVLIAFGWIDSGSLSLDRMGHIAPLFVGGAASGALYALPIAVPTIALTELTRFHSIWIFGLAGLATAAVMIGFLGTSTVGELLEGRPYAVRDAIVVTTVTVTASLTYWLVAWKLFPPKPPQAGDGAVPR